MKSTEKKVLIYVHGKGGNPIEAEHYKSLFPDFTVLGFDYKSENPWDAKIEFRQYFDTIQKSYDTVYLIANSIGAFFSLGSLADKKIEKTFLISPIVNMEKLISDMMIWANTSEEELKIKKEIKTAFGETLSWNYLCYVRDNPIQWSIPTWILYGAKDTLTSMDTIKGFADKNKARLTVMEYGEHWFHTEEQMSFLDNWIRTSL